MELRHEDYVCKKTNLSTRKAKFCFNYVDHPLASPLPHRLSSIPSSSRLKRLRKISSCLFRRTEGRGNLPTSIGFNHTKLYQKLPFFLHPASNPPPPQKTNKTKPETIPEPITPLIFYFWIVNFLPGFFGIFIIWNFHWSRWAELHLSHFITNKCNA